jgi:hypothetical protein
MTFQWTRSDLQAASSLFFLGHRPRHPEDRIGYPRRPEDRPHLAYYGTTRSGKSFGLQYALQQLADSRAAGFMFIDPHGRSYWHMASYLRQMGITERVLFWDINDPEYVVTYDPFAEAGHSPSYLAGSMATALLGTLGEGKHKDASDFAQLKPNTEDGFEALLRAKLPFVLSQRFFHPQETAFREKVSTIAGQESLLTLLGALPSVTERVYQLGPTYQRLRNLFRVDQLRLTFVDSGLNFRELMDDGWIVLVNTAASEQTEEAAYTFTRLLVRHLFTAAKKREEGADPFFLVIDEASRYFSPDVARILNEAGKFGLHLVAGMQGIQQAKHESEATYIAIQENVNGEIVMRTTHPEEKALFTERFFGDYIDLDEPKHMVKVAIPRTVAHTTTTRTVSSGGQSRSRTSSDDADVPGTSTDTDHDPTITETEIPGFRTEYDYDEIPGAYRSPEEQLRRMGRWFSLREPGEAQRFGVVRINELPPQRIEIPELAPAMYSPASMKEWLREKVKPSQRGTMPLVEAERRFADLMKQHLELLAGPPATASARRRRTGRPSTAARPFRPPK